MYASRLHEFCQLHGLDLPVYKVHTSERDGPDQTRLLSAMVTIKGLTFPTPWLWCKSPEEAQDCAAKTALEFFTGYGVSTSRVTVLPSSQPSTSTSSGVPDVHMYKNKLQEYTQKMLLQLPLYCTVNEGSQHEPKFRCTVTVQNTPYSSPQTFTQRKSAEQDAARTALESLQQNPKDEICPVSEDIAFCKSILNEYAVKMHWDMPSYETVQEEGPLSVFECTVHFHGVYYTGVKGKNKKEAEQKAARFVIRIILDMGASESKKVMSGIIQSKFKFYSAVSNTKDTDSIFSGIVDTNTSQSLPSDTVKKQAAYPPLHLSKKPRLVVPSQAVVPCIEFVPSGSVQASVASPSGSKRKRKSKMKAKRNRRTHHKETVALPVMTLAGVTPGSPSVVQ